MTRRKYTFSFFTSDNLGHIETLMKVFTKEVWDRSCRELPNRCFACHKKLILNWIELHCSTHYYVSCRDYKNCFIAKNRLYEGIEIPKLAGDFVGANHAIADYLINFNKIEWMNVDYEEPNFDWIIK